MMMYKGQMCKIEAMLYRRTNRKSSCIKRWSKPGPNWSGFSSYWLIDMVRLIIFTYIKRFKVSKKLLSLILETACVFSDISVEFYDPVGWEQHGNVCVVVRCKSILYQPFPSYMHLKDLPKSVLPRVCSRKSGWHLMQPRAYEITLLEKKLLLFSFIF